MNKEQLQTAFAWMESKAKTCYEATHLIISLGSSYVIYNMVVRKGVEMGFNIWLTALVAYVAAYTWYRGMEHTLKVVLPFSTAYVLQDKKAAKAFTKNQNRAGRSSLILSFLLVTATACLSFMVNPEISQGITQKEDTSAAVAQTESLSSSYDRDVEALREELASARQEDARRVSVAQAESEQLIINAAKSKGPGLYALWSATQDPKDDNYNSWCRTEGQLGAVLRTARRNGSRLVEDARQAATSGQIQTTLNNYLSNQSANRDSVYMTTASLLVSTNKAYEETLSRRNNILFYVVLFALALNIFSCAFMVIIRIETGSDIVDDDSPGLVKVAVKKIAGVNKKLARRLNERFPDFVGTVPAVQNSTHSTRLPKNANAQPLRNTVRLSAQKAQSTVNTSVPHNVASAQPQNAQPRANRMASPGKRTRGDYPTNVTKENTQLIVRRCTQAKRMELKYREQGKIAQAESRLSDHMKDRQWLEQLGVVFTYKPNGYASTNTNNAIY